MISAYSLRTLLSNPRSTDADCIAALTELYGDDGFTFRATDERTVSVFCDAVPDGIHAADWYPLSEAVTEYILATASLLAAQENVTHRELYEGVRWELASGDDAQPGPAAAGLER